MLLCADLGCNASCSEGLLLVCGLCSLFTLCRPGAVLNLLCYMGFELDLKFLKMRSFDPIL